MFWDRHVGGLVSLYELMEAFSPILTAGLFATLARGEHIASTKPAISKVPQEDIGMMVIAIFEPARVLCVEAGLKQSLAMLGRMTGTFSRGVKWGDAKLSLEHFRALLMSELTECHLFIAPKERVEFFNNPAPFGQSVFDAFPSARMDLGEAGSCWTCGRNNAVVYHLMCAGEIGLRALARDRRVELKDKTGAPIDLALGQWGELINGVEGKVSAIKKWEGNPRREEAIAFYNGALVEARAFNDGWRRHVMHGRSQAYQDDETMALIGHVRRFLTTLATRISEDRLTPEVW